MTIFYAIAYTFNNNYNLYNVQYNNIASFYNRTLRSQRTIRINNNAIRFNINLTEQNEYQIHL